MDTADFGHLIDIWRLAALDKTKGQLRLTPDPLTAHFVGMNCEARRRAPDGMTIAELNKPIEVDGDRLTSMLAVFGSGDLSLVAKSQNLVARVGGARSALRLIASDMDREMPSVPRDKVCKIGDVPKFRHMIGFLAGCVLANPPPYVLVGIQMVASLAAGSDDNLTMTATDLYHMGIVDTPIPLGGVDEAIVPAADFAIALSLLGDEGAMSFDDTNVYLIDRETVIRIGLIQAAGGQQFPDVRKSTQEKDVPHQVTIPCAEIARAVRAAAILDSEKVSVVVKDGKLSFAVRGAEVGDFVMEVGEGGAEEIQIAFGLKQLTPVGDMGDEVEMHYAAPNQPVLFLGKETGYQLWQAPVFQASTSV